MLDEILKNIITIRNLNKNIKMKLVVTSFNSFRNFLVQF